MAETTTAEQTTDIKLTNARGLLEQLWEEPARPSERWLRDQQRKKRIPAIRVAGRVFYDPEEVRRALKPAQTDGV